MSLLDKRILIVTGKGGTGKTTVTAALGLWAARAGRKTLIVECNGTQHVAPLFRQPAKGYTPTILHPNLSSMTITAEEAIEDYVVKQIKVRKLYQLVFRNRVMGPFMDAVPGLHDAVHLGKVFDLSEDDMTDGKPTWDLVIVDAPATGHGLHMLAAPQSLMELTRAGPVYEGVKLVHDVISNPDKTALVLTCIPEELPVNETLELASHLNEADHEIATVVLNEMIHTQLPSPEEWLKHKPSLLSHGDTSVQKAGQLMDRWMDRKAQQNNAENRLRNSIVAPLVSLPLLPDRALSFSELQQLSHLLEKGLTKP